jgi:hypothetical protein
MSLGFYGILLNNWSERSENVFYVLLSCVLLRLEMHILTKILLDETENLNYHLTLIELLHLFPAKFISCVIQWHNTIGMQQHAYW